MKKIFLILLILGFSAAVMAQPNTTKKDTTKKVTPAPPAVKPAPQFQLDFGKVVNGGQFSITLRGYQVDDYFTYESNGGDRIDNATDINAARATAYRKNHQAVLDSFNNALKRTYLSFITSEKMKWTAAQADSVKAAKADSLQKAKLKLRSK